MLVTLIGGRHHGHSERLDTTAPPWTVVMVDCPHCHRQHLISGDYITSWPGTVEFYWLDQFYWDTLGRRRNSAAYAVPDPDAELTGLTELTGGLGLDLQQLWWLDSL